MRIQGSGVRTHVKRHFFTAMIDIAVCLVELSQTDEVFDE